MHVSTCLHSLVNVFTTDNGRVSQSVRQPEGCTMQAPRADGLVNDGWAIVDIAAPASMDEGPCKAPSLACSCLSLQSAGY